MCDKLIRMWAGTGCGDSTAEEKKHRIIQWESWRKKMNTTVNLKIKCRYIFVVYASFNFHVYVEYIIPLYFNIVRKIILETLDFSQRKKTIHQTSSLKVI